MKKSKIYTISFYDVYLLYIQKVERKGHTKIEVDKNINWLTGYDEVSLLKVLDDRVDFETFFAQAPYINKNISLIKGMICGYRVETIEDELIRKIRCLDKMIDELAKGKKMEKILRN